jgi:hypothetical protein
MIDNKLRKKHKHSVRLANLCYVHEYSRCSRVEKALRQEQPNCLHLNVRVRNVRHGEMNGRLRHTKHSPDEENVTHNPFRRLPRHPTTAIWNFEGGFESDGRAFALIGLWSERRGDWWQRLGPPKEGESPTVLRGRDRGEGRLDISSRRSPLLTGFRTDGTDDVDPVQPFLQVDGVCRSHTVYQSAPAKAMKSLTVETECRTQECDVDVIQPYLMIRP